MVRSLAELKADLADSRAQLTTAVREGADEEVVDSIQVHIDFLRGEIKKARRKARRLNAVRAETAKSPTSPQTKPPVDDSPIDIAAAVRRILGHGDDADKLF